MRIWSLPSWREAERGPHRTLERIRVASAGYVPRTTPIPESTNCNFETDSLPTRVARKSLSTLRIWDTLATESFGKPVRRAERETFPGARLHLRLLVNGTQTMVAMRL